MKRYNLKFNKIIYEKYFHTSKFPSGDFDIYINPSIKELLVLSKKFNVINGICTNGICYFFEVRIDAARVMTDIQSIDPMKSIIFRVDLDNKKIVADNKLQIPKLLKNKYMIKTFNGFKFVDYLDRKKVLAIAA